MANGWLRNGTGKASWTLLLAHGAGAPMDTPFMSAISERLAGHGIDVIRFEFGYMAARRSEGKRKPPSPQARLLSEWRDAYAKARAEAPGRLAIGGKSMGGRMASLVADELNADALVCLGYPFHAVGKPDTPRTAHLRALATPTLIVQGERDAMGNRSYVEPLSLSPEIVVHWMEAADHDLKPLKRSGWTQEQHLDRTASAVSEFLFGLQ